MRAQATSQTSLLLWEILPHFPNLLKVTLLARFESDVLKMLPPLKSQCDNQRERKMWKEQSIHNTTTECSFSHNLPTVLVLADVSLHSCNHTLSLVFATFTFFFCSHDSFLRCATMLIHSLNFLIQYVWVLYNCLLTHPLIFRLGQIPGSHTYPGGRLRKGGRTFPQELAHSFCHLPGTSVRSLIYICKHWLPSLFSF